MTVTSISISFKAGASIATPTTLPGADQIKTYGLDWPGNWKTSNFTLVNSDESTTCTAEVRQHNYVNEITSVRDTTGGTPPPPTPFTYDKNGNLLSDGVRIYQYDAFNRLFYVKNASGTLVATYYYDTLNRRIAKIIADLEGGYGGLTGDIPAGTTAYFYDGRQITEDWNATGTPAWAKSYYWGQYIDELMFFAVPGESAPTTYRVLSDLLYRSVALVTTSNVVTEAYDTDAYGNTLCYSGPGTDDLWFTDDDVTTNSPINTTIFTGRQYDPESQIYYYRARYYSPSIGRFISRDPLVSPLETPGAGGGFVSRLSAIDKSLLRLLLGRIDTSGNVGFRFDWLSKDSLKNAERLQGLNLYEYVSNNPVNEFDPTGLFDWGAFWGGLWEGIVHEVPGSEFPIAGTSTPCVTAEALEQKAQKVVNDCLANIGSPNCSDCNHEQAALEKAQTTMAKACGGL